MKNKYFYFIGIILLAIDQAAKYLVYSRGFGGFLSHLGPLLSLRLFPNYDFAFSLKLRVFLIYLVYAVLLAVLLRWFYKVQDKKDTLKFGMTLILAGAISNILDRLMLGYVRDFIYIFWGNIFNFADIYIVAGILFLFF